MSSLATDIARHEKRMNDEAIAEDRLEDAKQRFRDDVLNHIGVEIFVDDGMKGFCQTVYHCDVVQEWDGPDLWACLARFHRETAANVGLAKHAATQLLDQLDVAMSEAQERYAPMMLAAEDKRAREHNDSLREPVDEMFFRRLG